MFFISAMIFYNTHEMEIVKMIREKWEMEWIVRYENTFESTRRRYLIIHDSIAQLFYSIFFIAKKNWKQLNL